MYKKIFLFENKTLFRIIKNGFENSILGKDFKNISKGTLQNKFEYRINFLSQNENNDGKKLEKILFCYFFPFPKMDMQNRGLVFGVKDEMLLCYSTYQIANRVIKKSTHMRDSHFVSCLLSFTL